MDIGVADMCNAQLNWACRPTAISGTISVIQCDSVPNKYITSAENVADQSCRPNTKKATGPDNIPIWVLRNFCWPDTLLALEFIHQGGQNKQCMKSAYVSPLPQVTPVFEVCKDLRTISLTILLAKGLEPHFVKWLRENILEKLTQNNLDQWRALLFYMHWWAFT